MLLELKSVFLNEGEVLTLAYEMDMSAIDFNGVKPFVTPVRVDVKAENRAGAVRLNADVMFDFCYPCDRCAVETITAYNYSFQHMLVLSLNDDSNDEYIMVQDYKLDLDELLRDDILLELPTKFLCKPDCRGMCPKCGKNLNEGVCDCVTRQVDPRLEILKKLIN